MWTTFAASSAFNDSLDSLASYVSRITEGELGTPRPYSVHQDHVVIFLLLISLILLVMAIGSSLRTVKGWFKDFFFPSAANDSETVISIRPLLLFFTTMTCITLGLCSFMYVTYDMDGFYILDSHLVIIGIFTMAFLLYFLLKWLLYVIVNNVLFGGKKSLQWNRVFLFLTAFEGVLLFPLLLGVVFFNHSVGNSIFYFASVLFFIKILTFYKSRCIFFKQKILFLQNILYFCALEMMPLLAFSGSWLMLAHFLKVNF